MKSFNVHLLSHFLLCKISNNADLLRNDRSTTANFNLANYAYGYTPKESHCVSVRIRSYSGLYSVRIRENTDQNNPEQGHISRSVVYGRNFHTQ